MDKDTRDARVRERAYRLWLEEGRPEGQALEHWEKATELLAQEDGTPQATEPNPSARNLDRSSGAQPVEPPEALENQGDFPGLTDQGEDSPQAPRRRRKR